MNLLLSTFYAALRLSTPLIFASMGGLVSEKSGVTNIALEGMMTMGAFFAVIGSYITGNPLIGVIFGILGGGAISVIHAIVCIRLRAQQTISGTAINLFSTAITSFVMFKIFNKGGQTDLVTALPFMPAKWFSEVPVVGSVLRELNWFIFMSFAIVILMQWLINRSVLGLRIRAAGEHPKAADTLGVDVIKIRYICVILSGILAGLGGAALSLSATPLFIEGMVAGRGFIALAAMVFGRWKPINTLAACIIFGLADAVQIMAQGLGWNMPSEFYSSIPYVMSIFTMILFAGKAQAPKACGIPYTRESDK